MGTGKFLVAALSASCTVSGSLADSGIACGALNPIATIAGQVGVRNEQEESFVELSDKVIAKFPAENTLNIQAGFPAPPLSRLVLLRVGTGDAHCPNMHRVLEIKEDGTFSLSKVFGNCSSLCHPKSPKIAEHRKLISKGKNPFFKDGAWHIGLAPYNPKEKIRWYVYAEGRVTRDGKEVVGPDWPW